MKVCKMPNLKNRLSRLQKINQQGLRSFEELSNIPPDQWHDLELEGIVQGVNPWEVTRRSTREELLKIINPD